MILQKAKDAGCIIVLLLLMQALFIAITVLREEACMLISLSFGQDFIGSQIQGSTSFCMGTASSAT